MAFLLACLYLVLLNKAWAALLFFSVSFAFKPQAVFLLPLLVILALWRKVPWPSFLLIPAVYGLAAWPAVALGRTWPEIVQTYLSRPSAGKALTHNAASLYVFVPQSALNALSGPGITLAVFAVLIWVVYTWRVTKRADRSTTLLLALISVTLTPFVLPNMHDRYFYPADVISIALAFSLPEIWYVPILFQLISGLSYSIYLLSASADNLALAASLNLLTLVMLVVRQVIRGQASTALTGQESSPA
jgi:Gpi18-like mannosyltransferase